ncbi:MAG: HAD family hydrolase [Clostridia bacterium]|nr:HAD family hydrolase [Clostridia bacterium]
MKKEYKYIFFDLDGTLTDSAIGITNSVAYALSQFGIEVKDKSELNRFVGPPLEESFRVFYGFSEEDALRGVDEYRVYYRDRGIFENAVYPGVPELLTNLRARGKKLILATSKPEFYAKQILEHFGLAEYFDFVAGATMDSSRLKKADVIAYALAECGITDTSECIMIGDRDHDIKGSRVHNIDCLAVLYGYGSLEEITSSSPAYVAETVEDILKSI